MKGQAELPMKQEVVCKIDLRLWVDARLSREQLITYVEKTLLEGFKENYSMTLQDKNSVKVLSLKEERDIYHPGDSI